jgi:hypothetical protein
MSQSLGGEVISKRDVLRRNTIHHDNLHSWGSTTVLLRQEYRASYPSVSITPGYLLMELSPP